MKQVKRPALLTIALLLGITLLFISSCVHDRIIINGEMAQYLAEAANDQLFDPEDGLRGNTTFNINNGGYLISDDENIWFLNKMRFEDGGEVHYLQHMLTNQIGSVSTRNNFLVELEGLLIGKYEEKLFAIDHRDGNKLIALDLESYSTEIISESSVSAALLVGDTLYWSVAESGDLWQLHLYGIGAKAKLVMSKAGKLVNIQSGRAYTLRSKNNEMVLVTVDIAQEREVSTTFGANYEKATIAGSWIYFMDGDCLKRQCLSGENSIITVMCDVAEYSAEGYWLSAIKNSGGIVVSHLDGTNIAKISDDVVEGLQLVNSRIYYHNGYDGNEIYTIDLNMGRRSALLGSSVTDGGIQFETISKEDVVPWALKFGDFARQVYQIRAFTDQTRGPFQGNILFIEFSADGKEMVFHRFKGSHFTPSEVGVLVIITHYPTILGQYTDGDLAFRQDSSITVFTPDNPKPFLTWSVEGRPPSETKIGSGDRYGLRLSWHQKGLDLIKLINAL